MNKEQTVTEALSLGLSQELVDFSVNTMNNRALNSEGITLGDKIKIIGFPETGNSQKFEGRDEVTNWVDVLTEGDRDTISLGNLIGTPKIAKYFNKERAKLTNEDEEALTELSDNFDAAKGIKVSSKRVLDALVDIAKNHVGKTFECTGIARNCGKSKLSTRYFWQEV